MLGRFASPLPLSRFPRLRDQCFLALRSLSLSWGRSLVTAFRSPATAAPSRKLPFQGQRSRPATSPPSTRPRHPFGSSAPQPLCPGALPLTSAASTPQARCGSFPCGPACRSCDLHSPSGDFVSLRIKAFNRSCCLPAHLTRSPDCLSLPATVSISSIGDGSTFLARYDSAG